MSFLDASKAFDRVNHKKLFLKLLERGVPVNIVKLLIFWYGNQLFSVKWGNTVSESFKVSNGVRQGGILSPYLFNVYVNDLLYELNRTGVGCRFDGVSMNNFGYADDLVILAPSPTGLQRLLTVCDNYANNHDIIFNLKKCVCMCVKPKGYKLRVPSVMLCGKSLEYVTSYKYLGHIISDDLSDNADIKKQLGSIYCRANVLIRKFHDCTASVKCLLFKSFCTNIYCSELWWQYNISNYKKIKVAYNNSLRYLLNYRRDCSASGMFLENNIDSFDVVRRKSVYRFINRIYDSDNTILKNLTNNILTFYSSSGVCEWYRLLY